MKRLRRVSLRVEHREVSITMTQTIEGGEGRTGAAAWPDDWNGPGGKTPDVCPECGAPSTADFQSALNELSIPMDRLQSALLDRRVHSGWMPDGQLWVCERSLQILKEQI